MKRLLIPALALALLSSCGEKAKGQAATEETSKPMDIELAEKKLESGSPVFIRAFKEERVLELFIENKATGKFELFRTYPIAAASGQLGPKLAEGDRQVPEGFYFSRPGDMNPNSSFHLSFNVNYPNLYDRAHDRTGSYIMVHGSNISVGCLAMTDAKIEEIYSLCRVHFFPFRMTPERMAQAAASPHLPFWENLKTGYDLFEKNKIPPTVSVRDKVYVFE
jgi:murein L,D-transpeptidase YafK